MRRRRYFLEVGGGAAPAGPFALEQIEGMWSTGQITDDARVMREGGRRWESVGVALRELDRERRRMPLGKFLTWLTMAAVGGLTIGIVLWDMQQPRAAVKGGPLVEPLMTSDDPRLTMRALSAEALAKVWAQQALPDPEAEVTGIRGPEGLAEGPVMLVEVRMRAVLGGWGFHRYFLFLSPSGDRVTQAEPAERYLVERRTLMEGKAGDGSEAVGRELTRLVQLEMMLD
jgi:hypothetical protein